MNPRLPTVGGREGDSIPWVSSHAGFFCAAIILAELPRIAAQKVEGRKHMLLFAEKSLRPLISLKYGKMGFKLDILSSMIDECVEGVLRLLSRDLKSWLCSGEGASEMRRPAFFRGINQALVRCQSTSALWAYCLLFILKGKDATIKPDPDLDIFMKVAAT
ncbi:hypothetical protein Tco_0749158 [Tanacetum coccineum]|uniref:Uncharacterized protein n=1 Tax=Tanacetum coccineum TaxID=301880 RepID=A0ABQ4Z0M7_9ASTR